MHNCFHLFKDTSDPLNIHKIVLKLGQPSIKFELSKGFTSGPVDWMVSREKSFIAFEILIKGSMIEIYIPLLWIYKPQEPKKTHLNFKNHPEAKYTCYVFPSLQ